MTGSRLSLVAQFDDLVRNTSVLTAGIETEFLRFVQNQEKCRLRWFEAEGGSKGQRDKMKQLENENSALQTRLKHARNQIDHEMKRRLKAEQERDLLERQITLVRELLMEKNNRSVLNDQDRERLAFLNSTMHTTRGGDPSPRKSLSIINETGSLLSDADISYDKTEEDLDDPSYLRNGKPYKRPSAPPMEEDLTPPGKKTKKDRKSKHRRSRSAQASVVATTTINMTNDAVRAQAEVTSPDGRTKKRTVSARMKRHHSEKNLSKKQNDSDESYTTARTGITPHKYMRTQSPGRTPEGLHDGLRHHGSASSLNKPHFFVQKTIIKPESCNPCGKKIGFGKPAMKCRDCKATAHHDCKDLVPLPCVPSTATPGNKKMFGYLADYAPNDPPMIPALVILCVNEISARGLGEEGIYRVPGSDREVKDLKEKFLRGKSLPNLSHVNDINVICGCLKDFLRGLKEPLVTYNLWKDFVNAAQIDDEDDSHSALYQAISQLPQANRDTLAFLVLHLQTVSESEGCKMNKTNLARVFGPTVVGNSTENPEPMQIMSETSLQNQVMLRVLGIHSDYWTTFINIDVDRTMYPADSYTPNTPDARTMPHSMLGPIHTPNEDANSTEKKSTWFGGTPKFSTKSRQVNKKPTHFFSSPMLR